MVAGAPAPPPKSMTTATETSATAAAARSGTRASGPPAASAAAPAPSTRAAGPRTPRRRGGHDPRAGLAATATIGSLRDTGANEPANRADPKAYTEPSAPAIQ